MNTHDKKRVEVDTLRIILDFLKAKQEAGATLEDVIASVERGLERKRAE